MGEVQLLELRPPIGDVASHSFVRSTQAQQEVLLESSEKRHDYHIHSKLAPLREPRAQSLLCINAGMCLCEPGRQLTKIWGEKLAPLICFGRGFHLSLYRKNPAIAGFFEAYVRDRPTNLSSPSDNKFENRFEKLRNRAFSG